MTPLTDQSSSGQRMMGVHLVDRTVLRYKQSVVVAVVDHPVLSVLVHTARLLTVLPMIDSPGKTTLPDSPGSADSTGLSIDLLPVPSVMKQGDREMHLATVLSLDVHGDDDDDGGDNYGDDGGSCDVDDCCT